MNVIDVLVLAFIGVYAFAGYQSGFVRSLAEVVGLVCGAAVGIVLAPLAGVGPSDKPGAAFVPLMFVVLLSIAGQLVGRWLARGVSLKNGTLRDADAAGGLALGVVTALVAAWALGFAAASANLPWLGPQARGSVILGSVNQLMPDPVGQAVLSATRKINGGATPNFVAPYTDERVRSTEPPDPAILETAGVQKASNSIVKITGSAECGRGIEGSGFVYASHRVMTNAHVVAGVSTPRVTLDGVEYSSIPVVFDADLDLAVLYVPELEATPLRFDDGGIAGQSAAVLGYPENGPFDAQPARIRDEVKLSSADIYGNGNTARQSFSIRALVRSGNSGGPLVGENGKVLGVIFAASVEEDSTGYALTAAEARDTAVAGQAATQPVSTGSCVSS